MYKLECLIGISTTKKKRITTHEKGPIIFHVLKNSCWHVILALFNAMNKWQGVLFLYVNSVGFLLEVTCLYGKQNNRWLQGIMEFLFMCSIWYLMSEHSNWVRYQVEKKFHVSACPCKVKDICQRKILKVLSITI